MICCPCLDCFFCEHRGGRGVQKRLLPFSLPYQEVHDYDFLDRACGHSYSWTTCQFHCCHVLLVPPHSQSCRYISPCKTPVRQTDLLQWSKILLTQTQDQEPSRRMRERRRIMNCLYSQKRHLPSTHGCHSLVQRRTNTRQSPP